MKTAALLLLLLCVVSACSAPRESAPASSATTPAASPVTTVGEPSMTEQPPPPPGTVTRGDGSTDLATTPLSAADYAMYAAIMGGASAMLAALSPEDTAALELARKVKAGTAKVTPATEPLLARATALTQQDLELARLQGIGPRYQAVKTRIEAVIGPHARPPAPDDAVAKENLRYLEAHRDSIERLQRILDDPLSREAR